MSVEELLVFIKKIKVKDYEEAKYSSSLISKEIKKLEGKTKCNSKN